MHAETTTTDLGALHSGALHSGSHNGAGSSLRSELGNIGVLLFKLDSFDILLVLNFLLDVLVSLEELVMFGLSELKSLVEVGFELLLESVHLVLLLLDQFGLGSDDLLCSLLHVLLSFVVFEILRLHLDLMSFGVPIFVTIKSNNYKLTFAA